MNYYVHRFETLFNNKLFIFIYDHDYCIIYGHIDHIRTPDEVQIPNTLMEYCYEEWRKEENNDRKDLLLKVLYTVKFYFRL